MREGDSPVFIMFTESNHSHTTLIASESMWFKKQLLDLWASVYSITTGMHTQQHSVYI